MLIDKESPLQMILQGTSFVILIVWITFSCLGLPWLSISYPWLSSLSVS